MRLGAELGYPAQVLMFNEVLGAEMYRKLVLNVDGTCESSTMPVTLLYPDDNWRVWQLSGDREKHLYVAWHPHTDKVNKWWESLMSKIPLDVAVKVMYGDLAVFVHRDNLEWNELELRRELINWLVCKYRLQTSYKFCDF